MRLSGAGGERARLAVEVGALRAALPGEGIVTDGASSSGVQPADSPTVALMSLPGQRRGPARFAPGLAERAAAIEVLRADGFPVGADEVQEGPAFGPLWNQGKTCEILNTATPCDGGAKWIHPRCVCVSPPRIPFPPVLESRHFASSLCVRACREAWDGWPSLVTPQRPPPVDARLPLASRGQSDPRLRATCSPRWVMVRKSSQVPSTSQLTHAPTSPTSPAHLHIGGP